jgi:hypothetical protein
VLTIDDDNDPTLYHTKQASPSPVSKLKL